MKDGTPAIPYLAYSPSLNPVNFPYLMKSFKIQGAKPNICGLDHSGSGSLINLIIMSINWVHVQCNDNTCTILFLAIS